MDAITALAEVLGLDAIPFDVSGPDRAPGSITIVLRSTRTRGEMLAAMAPHRADRRREQATTYAEHLDEVDEICWDIRCPRPTEFFAAMTLDEWISWEAGKFPEGYLPVKRLGDPDEVIELRTAVQVTKAASKAAEDAEKRRNEAIRRCLAAGMSASRIMAETGLSKPRVYQIRDGRR